MATYQSLKNRMSTIGHDTRVAFQHVFRFMYSLWYTLPSVIPSLIRDGFPCVQFAHNIRERAYVPQFDRLILAVCDEISTVTARVDVRDPVHVTSQHSHRMRIRLVQRSPVPDLTETVVSGTVQNLRRIVSKNNCIHIVVVALDPKRALMAFPVVDV